LLGKRYRMSSRDHAAVRFLKELAIRLRYVDEFSQRQTLLTFREDFKAITADRPIPGLVWSIHYLPPRARRIALWLLGRIGNKQTASVVSHCVEDPDIATRRTAVQALRRLSAWATLRRIAQQERDPVIRRLAAAAERPPAEFAGRLERFVRNDVDEAETQSDDEPDRIALAINVQPGSGLPPKSPWFIRRILEHIRWLVGHDPPVRFRSEPEKESKPPF
jgi:hypothetical protein